MRRTEDIVSSRVRSCRVVSGRVDSCWKRRAGGVVLETAGWRNRAGEVVSSLTKLGAADDRWARPHGYVRIDVEQVCGYILRPSGKKNKLLPKRTNRKRFSPETRFSC